MSADANRSQLCGRDDGMTRLVPLPIMVVAAALPSARRDRPLTRR